MPGPTRTAPAVTWASGRCDCSRSKAGPSGCKLVLGVSVAPGGSHVDVYVDRANAANLAVLQCLPHVLSKPDELHGEYHLRDCKRWTVANGALCAGRVTGHVRATDHRQLCDRNAADLALVKGVRARVPLVTVRVPATADVM